MAETLTADDVQSRSGPDLDEGMETPRVLVIDDNTAIHDDFRKILADDEDTTALDEAREALFGEAHGGSPGAFYEIDSAYQGQEGLAKVQEAVKRRRPYTLAFVDMRMPPGWDGLETIERIWREDSEIQTVICTAYSDYPWSEIVARLGQSDRLLILKKPFDRIEVCQLASALSKKRRLTRQATMKMNDLEKLVEKRTAELTRANTTLQTEIQQRTKSEAQVRAIVESAADCIVSIDETGKVIEFNPAAEKTFGYRRAEAAGKRLVELIVPPPLRAKHTAGLRRYLKMGKSEFLGKRLELTAVRRDGTELPIEMTLTVVPQGEHSTFTAILRDVTQRKEMERELEHLAFHDALTGLANRSMFVDRVGHALRRYRRRGACRFAVLFLDLDRFKSINDALGHVVGDKLLAEAAQRLAACVRPADTVARLGGDEFAVLVEEAASVADVVRLAERIKEALGKPFDLDGREVFVTASIGIAANTTGYVPAEDILRDADMAMYRAKTGGRNRCALFSSTIRRQADAVLELENDLRHAAERNEFRVVYQPIVSLQTNQITGLEALARWEHPRRGLLLPEQFLAAAEDTRVIIPMGWTVFRTACRALSRWRSELPGAASLSMSVNFSPTQIAETDIVGQISNVAAQSGADPRSFVVEVTEHAVFKDPRAAAAKLAKLASLGVCLCIDDFGTGYASLTSLRQFPFTRLKIDRSFVSGTGNGEQDWQIIEGIIALAHSLGIEVVGEGVETREQLSRLRALKCDYAQGYLLAAPAGPDEVRTLLSGRGPPI